MIQEYAAVRLGLDLGTYTHFIGSAHVNDRNADRVERVLAEADGLAEPRFFPFPAMPRTTTPAAVARVLEHEEALRTNEVHYNARDILGLDLEVYWQQMLLLFELYRQIQHDRPEAVSDDILSALIPGLRWLVGHRWPQYAAASLNGAAR
ncbi:hypothetical protein ABZX85_48555 [Streptomyces sp. NPDC004539]|uniref:hypothetical protein n=1 Tax=Streptomyces sp. NPDC004539 TaxID=3154280 RepID=UPI0033B50248